jgi:hypothetical protein
MSHCPHVNAGCAASAACRRFPRTASRVARSRFVPSRNVHQQSQSGGAWTRSGFVTTQMYARIATLIDVLTLSSSFDVEVYSICIPHVGMKRAKTHDRAQMQVLKYHLRIVNAQNSTSSTARVQKHPETGRKGQTLTVSLSHPLHHGRRGVASRRPTPRHNARATCDTSFYGIADHPTRVWRVVE